LKSEFSTFEERDGVITAINGIIGTLTTIARRITTTTP